jgi:hypothetical protein
MIALNTGSYGAAQTATSRGIALGQNDQFLFQLNAVVARSPATRFYVRPFPEMNAHWSGTSAYNRDGTRRDAAHSTQWTRKAFARIAVVLRGGARDVVSASLAKLGLPGIAADLPVTTPKLRLVWNPQGFGAPDVAGNSAQAYYPGDAYVRVPRVRALGLRRSTVHPRHGEMGEAAPAGGVHLVLLRPPRIDLGSRDQACVALGVRALITPLGTLP